MTSYPYSTSAGVDCIDRFVCRLGVTVKATDWIVSTQSETSDPWASLI